MIGTGILEHLATRRTLCFTEDRVGLNGDDTPAHVAIHSANRKKIWASSSNVYEYTVMLFSKKSSVDDPIELMFGARPHAAEPTRRIWGLRNPRSFSWLPLSVDAPRPRVVGQGNRLG